MKKKIGLILKISVSIALLYFIFNKIPFSKVSQTLSEVVWSYLGLAGLFFVISKIIAAQRLQDYWQNIHIKLSNSYHLKLYLLGMFYNLFLPGGIGGDAYKGYLLKKHFHTPTKKIVGALLLDRLSGLFLLVLFAGVLALVPVHPILAPYIWWIIIALPLGSIIFYFGVKKWYPHSLLVFWPAALKSAAVQCCQLICAFFILKSLGAQQDFGVYLLLFLISSIVAVLPFTLGGVGSRELTFLLGAQWFGLDYEKAIAMSLLFFLITAVISLCGGWFHLKKPSLVKLN